MKRRNLDLKRFTLPLALTSILALGNGFPLGHQAIAQDLDSQIDLNRNRDIQDNIRPNGDLLLQWGKQAHDRGDLAQSLAYWQEAIQYYHQSGDYQSLALSYDYLSRTYLRLERYTEAEEAIRRNLALLRSNRDVQGQIYGLNSLGMLLVQTQDFPVAAEVFYEALTISRSIEDDRGEGLSFNNLGVLAAAQGNHNIAIKHYQDALTSRRRGRDMAGEISTLNNLGMSQQANNQYEQSLYSFRLARKLAIISEEVNKKIIALQGLVTGYHAVNNGSMVRNHLTEWLDLARTENNLPQEFLAVRFASRYEVKLGDTTKAISLYQQAIALAKTLGYSEQVVVLTNELAQIVYDRSGE